MGNINLPVLVIRDPNLIVFPHSYYEVNIGRKISSEAINAAKLDNSNIIIAFQSDPNVDEPTNADVYNICVEARIETVVSEEDNNQVVVVYGLNRLKLDVFYKNNTCYYGEASLIKSNKSGTLGQEQIDEVRQLREIISEYAKNIKLPKESPDNFVELDRFVDMVGYQLPVEGKQRFELLRACNPVVRLSKTLKIAYKMANHEEVSVSSSSSPVEKFKSLLETSGIYGEAKKVAKQEVDKLGVIHHTNSEYHVAYNYLDTILSLPWDKRTEDELDIKKAYKVLEKDHYGLEKVKQKILEFLAVKKLAPKRNGEILCLVGAPGIGKTSIVKSIAKAMGREFIRTSLGGIRDEAEIRGHRRTYIGSMPGRIIQLIKRIGYKNPVFALDELDKLCRDFRGDPSSALLEALDPEQNGKFVDNYLGVPFDLSEVMFVATANELVPIPAALRDRLEIIELPGYSAFDKVRIAQHYLIPKQKEKNGLENYDILINDDTIIKIIEEYTDEAGVRSLERECGKVIRKIAVSVASGEEYNETIDTNDISNYLGPPKRMVERMSEVSEIGVSTGLSCGPTGGSILFIETSLTPGRGEMVLTGNLGKVIQESAQAALTWIKSNANELGVDLKHLRKNNIHLHLPAGAVSKEGPSAGIAIAASILSLLTSKPVRNDVAMTGEITLRGRVLPIGGLREKVMAARRAGINKIVFPVRNKHDTIDIPKDVLDEIELYPVSNLEEALKDILLEIENVELVAN